MLLMIFAVSLLTSGVAGGQVLVIVMEGVTESLLSHVPTPAIDALASQGVLVSLKPEFPASLLPSLASMMTGQHPEVTGIMDTEVSDDQGGILSYNKDPEFWIKTFNLTDIKELNSGIEGQKTGCVQWPGTNIETMGCDRIWKYGDYDIVTDVDKINTSASSSLKNRRKGPRSRRSLEDEYELEESLVEAPVIKVENITDSNLELVSDNSKKEILDEEKFFFNKTTDAEWLQWSSQIESIVKWMTAETDPLNFVLFNVAEPAYSIRAFGPDSVEGHQALQKVDQMIALLVERLQTKGVLDDINIVITGVHGFVEISADKIFNVKSILPTSSDGILFGHSPVLNIKHTMGNDLDILLALQTAPTEKFDFYIRSKLPDSLHYKNSDRVGIITLVAKEGFAFEDVFHEFKSLDTEHQRPADLGNKYGLAGYDNSLESMQSLVILRGPGVQRSQPGQQELTMIETVDMFPLISHLLGIPEVPSKGSLNAVRSLLINPPSQSIEAIKKVIEKIPKVIENYISGHEKFPKAVLILTVCTVIILFMLCCCACAIRSRRKNLGKNHNYKYSAVKHNRRTEGREDGNEGNDDKVGLLTSALMEEELEENLSV